MNHTETPTDRREGGSARTRRVRTVAAAVAVALVLGAILNAAIPWLLVRAGIGSGYDVGLLRWGRAEYVKRLNLSDQARTRTVGYAFLREGEALQLRWDVTIRDGDATLAVDEFLGGGMDPLWREHLTRSSTGEVDVPSPSSGLYQIRLSRTGWAGRAIVRWSVEGSERAGR